MASPPADTYSARESSAREGSRHRACRAHLSSRGGAAKEPPLSARWHKDLCEQPSRGAEGTGAGETSAAVSEQPNCERWRKLLQGALQEEGLGGSS